MTQNKEDITKVPNHTICKYYAILLPLIKCQTYMMWLCIHDVLKVYTLEYHIISLGIYGPLTQTYIPNTSLNYEFHHGASAQLSV